MPRSIPMKDGGTSLWTNLFGERDSGTRMAWSAALGALSGDPNAVSNSISGLKDARKRQAAEAQALQDAGLAQDLSRLGQGAARDETGGIADPIDLVRGLGAGYENEARVPLNPHTPSMSEAYPVLMSRLRDGADPDKAMAILKAAQPNLTAVNGEMVDTTDRANAGRRVGVHLSNVNGFQVDDQNPANAGRYYGEAPVKGAEPLFDQRGQQRGWHMMDGSIQSIQDTTAATERGKGPDVRDVTRGDGGHDLVPVQRGEFSGSGGAGGGRMAAAPMGGLTSRDPTRMLADMISLEAGNQGPEGMAAAAHVARTRAARGGFGGNDLPSVLTARTRGGNYQFEGMKNVANLNRDSPRYQQALQIAQGVMSGEIPDPTGGATNFINPRLQAQLGRRQPGWAPQGGGTRIGDHVFYGGQNGGGEGARGPALRGGPRADALANAPRLGAGPQPYYSTPGAPTAPRDQWVQINAQQQRNSANGEVKKVDPASLSTGLQKMEDSDLDAVNAAQNSSTRAAGFRHMIDKGDLHLNPGQNLLHAAQNAAGFGSAQSTNYSEFKAFTEQLRNDTLRLNKGVQTEGDAQRELNSLFQSFGDEKAVKAALGRIETLNARAVAQRTGIINNRRQSQGVPMLPKAGGAGGWKIVGVQ